MFRQNRLARGVRATVLGVVIATLSTSAAAAGATPAGPDHQAVVRGSCRMSLLPVPAGTVNSMVTGGDHSGRYLVGQAVLFDGTQYTFDSLLWINGEMRRLAIDALAPFLQVNVTDVNSHGVVVGYRFTNTFGTDAWVRRDARFTILPGLKATDETRATAINSRGDIVGTSEDYSASPVVFHAVIWPADRPGTVRELTVNGASPPWATGVDIDDDGTVLGQLGQTTAPDQQAYVWPARGRSYPLAAPAGTSLSAGVAIHDGWVAGTVMRDNGDGTSNSVVARWHLPVRTATVISTSYGSAFAVNNDGTVAAFGALLYSNGQVRPLGDSAQPAVLSDHGMVAGTDPSLFGNAVIWTGC